MIWLLSKGRTVGETAEVTAISERWVSKLAERYGRRGAWRLAICGAATEAPGGFCLTTTLRLCASVCARRRTTGASGAGRRLRAEARLVLGLSMFMRRAAGKR